MSVHTLRPRSAAALLLALSFAACAEEPTGVDAPRPGPWLTPQFSAVPSYSSFERVTIAGAPTLPAPAFGQLQAIWPVSTSQIFVSRGDDWFLRLAVTDTTAAFVDGYQATGGYQLGAWAASPTDFWGAHASNPNFATSTSGFLYRYDGSWSQHTTGLGSTFATHALYGFGASDIWAVGRATADSTIGRAAHYDGSGWTEVTLPTGTKELWGVWGAAANDVWAVGRESILHFDGSNWSSVAAPTGYILRDVWGTSASDVWVVGDDASASPAVSIILHYDGASWTPVAFPFGGQLHAVQPLSASEVYLAGGRGLFRWDGASWTRLGDPALLHPTTGDTLGYFDMRIGHGRLYGASWEGYLIIAPLNGGIAGTVTADGTGDPISGATVTIVQTGQTDTTDANGFYSLAGVAPGDYDVNVQATGFQQQTAQTTVASGATTTLSFALGVAFSVTVHGSVVPDVAVTLTNVDTGDYYVVCTDAAGVASFEVPAGNYLIHARNLFLCDEADLAVWADPDETKVHDTSGTENQNRVGVLYKVGATNNSVTLNPANYKLATASPIVLGQGQDSTVEVTFQTGATIACELLDDGGGTFTLTQSEHVFAVLPFGDETGLPPVDNPDGLPRAIGNVLATIPAGSTSDDCSVSGVPAGDYVLETNVVVVDGEEKVYRESVTVTEQDAQSGETVEATMEPEPSRARTDYLFDPLGDSGGQVDIGPLLTYGWGETAGAPNDDFIVASGFRLSPALQDVWLALEIRYTHPVTSATTSVRAEAKCNLSGSIYSCAVDGITGAVSVTVTGSGRVDGGVADVTVVWTATLPGVEELEFRVTTGPGRSAQVIHDAAPASGFQPATKPDDGGNSWAIMGDG